MLRNNRAIQSGRVNSLELEDQLGEICEVQLDVDVCRAGVVAEDGN